MELPRAYTYAVLRGWLPAWPMPPWWLRLLFRMVRDQGEVVVDPDRGDYLVRFTILRTRRLRLYLHLLLQDDAGRSLHCHPWTAFVSVPLVRGYEEVREHGTLRVRPFWPRLRPRSVFHRVTGIAPGHPAITLVAVFVADRRDTSWGFDVNRRLVPSQAYPNLGTKEFFDVRARPL